MKKSVGIIVCWAIVTLVANGIAVGSQAKINRLEKEIFELQEEIKMLNAAVKKQAETIKDYQQLGKDYFTLKKQFENACDENSRMKMLCKRKGVNVAKSTPDNPADYCIYKGMEYDKKFFDRYWLKYKDEYVKYKGVIYNITSVEFDNATKKDGLRLLGFEWKVLNVLGNGCYLLIDHAINSEVIYIDGLPKGYIDEEKVGAMYAERVGNYQYSAVNGSVKTVAKYKRAAVDLTVIDENDFKMMLEKNLIDIYATKVLRGRKVEIKVR